jgi:glycerol uptake facilitator-like aquaporin
MTDLNLTSVFAKEAVASALFFLVFFGALTVLQGHVQWIVHFILVFVFDVFTGGIMNPLTVLALFICGDGLTITATRMSAEAVGGLLGFVLTRAVLPASVAANLGCPHPAVGFDLHTAYLNEFTISFVITLVVLAAINSSIGQWKALAIIALTVRVLIQLGTYTGSGMNPMVGLACWNEPSLRKEHVSSSDYFSIYISVPFMGAAVATLLYLNLQKLQAASKKKTL